jgi:hypothetical protein
MRRFVSLKAVAVIAAASMAFAGSALAFDDDEDDESDGKEVVIGIIGEVLGQAAEKKEQRELERRCRRFNQRCEDGSEWACERYENSCAD